MIGGIDEIGDSNKNLSVFEDASRLARRNNERMEKDFIKSEDFPIHKPYYQLTKEQNNYLWRGKKQKFPTIDNFFKMLENSIKFNIE